MNIMKLDLKDKKKAAKVLAAAFYDYPQIEHYFPDVNIRSRYLEWYMKKVMNCALRYGEAYISSGFEGVIFILPPGHTKISNLEYAINGFVFVPLIFGLQQHHRILECEDFVMKMHEDIMNGRPHYYLWGLAVDPGHQRNGVGRMLLNQMLEKADFEKKPVYLETHDEKNVRYYQQKGFALVESSTITGQNLRIWCMVREPKALAAGED